MNLKQAKVIMFDLDGTIIQNGSYIDPLTIDALTRLKANGYTLCINSGRPHFLTLKVLDDYKITPLFDYLFGCNGSELLDIKSGKLEQLAWLEPHTVKKVVKVFENDPMAIAILTSKVVYVDKVVSERIIDIYRRTRKMEVEIIDFNTVDYSVSKLLGIIDDDGYPIVKEHIKHIDSEEYDLFFSNNHLLEIVPTGSNKGQACKILKKRLKLKMEDIIAFGDEENDIAMFKETIGVAMGNANEDVQKHAQYVTERIDEKGISAFLEKYSLIQLAD